MRARAEVGGTNKDVSAPSQVHRPYRVQAIPLLDHGHVSLRRKYYTLKAIAVEECAIYDVSMRKNRFESALKGAL